MKDTKLKFNPATTTLKEAIQEVCYDPQGAIPFWVWLIENPQSPLPLPGQIDLYNHDCLHALFGLGISLEDEAFILGFTMGSDLNTKPWHLQLFKFISQYLYPEKFRFRPQDFRFFELGLEYSRTLSLKNINKVNFHNYEHDTVANLRKTLDIEEICLDSLIKDKFTPSQNQTVIPSFSY